MEYASRVGLSTPDDAYAVAVGLIECASIATGYLVADTVLKQAPVEMLWARTISPGRFLVMFTGEVEEVRFGLDSGLPAAGKDVVDELFIPNLHLSIPARIREPNSDLEFDALGIVEFSQVSSTIVAADTAVKVAAVEIVEIRLGMHLGGKGFFLVTGAVSDVEDAVAAAAAVGRQRSTLVREVVIPRVTQELIPHIVARHAEGAN